MIPYDYNFLKRITDIAQRSLFLMDLFIRCHLQS